MTKTIAPSSLPALSSFRIKQLRLNELPNRFSAYGMILQAEQQAVERQDTISARIVGYLLLEFHERSRIFGDAPCATLVKWATSMPRIEDGGTEREVIYRLGTMLRDKFIRSFRISDATYESSSFRSSSPSFETVEDMVRDTMELTTKEYKTFRRRALARDGFRCMVTGMLDDSSVYLCHALSDEAERNHILAVEVESAHILNESTIQGIDSEGVGAGDTTSTYHAADAMTILNTFGFSDFTEASGGVHEVWNLLSLEPNIHRKFYNLELWFEHTQKPGRYKICLLNDVDEGYIRRNFVRPEPYVDGAPMFVEFTSQFEHVPPPHPRLLAFHATCARVIHMSGAAEFFDKLEFEEEWMDVLASDGSSTLLL